MRAPSCFHTSVRAGVEYWLDKEVKLTSENREQGDREATAIWDELLGTEPKDTHYPMLDQIRSVRSQFDEPTY